MRRALAVLLMVGFLTVSCSAFACACSTPVVPLTVFGAASLKTALDEMKNSYENSHPSVRISISTGSSAALRTQIQEGAEADVFLSADQAQPQALADAGLTDGPATPFASNRLTIVVPRGNPAGITSPADLAREGVTVIAAGEDVPVTGYAEQAVDQLAVLPGYPTDYAAAYESNVASREDNVGAIISKIGLGEGDAAIVYATDAQAAGLQTIDIPAEASVVATYAAVVLKDAASSSTARDFLEWVRAGAGQQILSNLGFLPAS